MAPVKSPKRAILEGGPMASTSSASTRRDGLAKRCQIDGFKAKTRASRNMTRPRATYSSTLRASSSTKEEKNGEERVSTPAKKVATSQLTVVKTPTRRGTPDASSAFGRTIKPRLCNTCSKITRQESLPGSPRSAPRSTEGGRRKTTDNSKTWRELMSPQVSPSTRRALILKEDKSQSNAMVNAVKSKNKNTAGSRNTVKSSSKPKGKEGQTKRPASAGVVSGFIQGRRDSNASLDSVLGPPLLGPHSIGVGCQSPESDPKTKVNGSASFALEDDVSIKDYRRIPSGCATQALLVDDTNKSPSENRLSVVDTSAHGRIVKHVKFAPTLLGSSPGKGVSGSEMNDLLTPQLNRVIADLEASSSIPHLEYTVLDLESKVSTLTDELTGKNVHIDELLRIVKDQERRLEHEKCRRIEAEAREKTSKEQARSSALEQVRMAMSPECTGSSRQASVRGHEVTRLSDRLNRLNVELDNEKVKRTEEVKHLEIRCKDEVQRAREVKDALFSANIKQLELHKEVARLNGEIQRRDGMKREECIPGVQAELISLREKLREVKETSMETLESTEASMKRTHESLVAYVAEEIDAQQYKSAGCMNRERPDIKSLQEELAAALEHISSFEAADKNSAGANGSPRTPSSSAAPAAVIEASPVPSMESWKNFAARFKQALSGRLNSAEHGWEEQPLDGLGMIRAEKLFKELCFSCSTPVKQGSRLANTTGRLYDDALFFDAINPEGVDFVVL